MNFRETEELLDSEEMMAKMVPQDQTVMLEPLELKDQLEIKDNKDDQEETVLMENEGPQVG